MIFGAQRGPISTYVNCAVILLVGIIAYANTFHVPFQLDEELYLKQNPFVQDCRYPLDELRAPQASLRDPGQMVSGNELFHAVRMRYVAYLTFAANYHLQGEQVEGYHAVNLSIHLLTALLLYALVLALFAGPRMQDSALAGRRREIAFFTALLFVSHPVQTEAVTYIMQRLASLAALWYVAAVLCYVRFSLAGTNGRRAVWYVCSLIAALLAMKTKENAFTLPLMIALFDLVLFPGTVAQRVRRLAPLLATLLIIPLSLLSVHAGVTQAVAPATLRPLPYFLTQLRVLVDYLLLLAWPVGQSVMHEVPVSRSLVQPEVLISGFIVLAFASLGVFLTFRKGGEPGLRAAGLGILWFFIASSVESSFLPLPILMCEYRVYLPSAGIFLASVTSAYACVGAFGGRSKRYVAGALVVLVIVLSTATVSRNHVWGSIEGLWEDAAAKAPSAPGIHMKLGARYAQQGRLDHAIAEYEAAARLGMDHPRLHFILGESYQRANRHDDAIREFQAVLRVLPDFVQVHSQLGDLFLQKGDYASAEQAFKDAIRLEPDSFELHGNLGGVYVQQGRYREAREEILKALTLNPDSKDARYNLQMVEDLLRKGMSRKTR